MMLRNISGSSIEQIQDGIFHELKPGDSISLGIFEAQLWLSNHASKLEKLDDEFPFPVEEKKEEPLMKFPPIQSFKKRGRPRKV